MSNIVKWKNMLSTTEPFNNIGLVKVRQDNTSETWEIRITENGRPYDFSKRKITEVYFNTKFSRNRVVEQRGEIIDVKKGIIQYTMNNHDMQEAKPFQAAYFEFRSADGSYVDSTQTFFYHIIPSKYKECTEGSTYIVRLEELFKLYMDYHTKQTEDWERFVESNREILESVDPGGKILTELIDARTDYAGNYFNDLKNRIDDISIKDTTKYYIEKKKKVQAGELIETLGFYNLGSNKINYLVNEVDASDSWTDTGKGFSINDNLEIKIDDTHKITPIFPENGTIHVSFVGCDGDDDTIIFQKVMNYAINKKKPINLDCKATLTDSIQIDRHVSDRYQIHVFGSGVLHKSTNGPMFNASSSTAKCTSGNIVFRDTTLTANPNNQTSVVNGSDVIRVRFINNLIEGFYNIVLDDAKTDSYIQTIYISNNTIIRSKGILVDTKRAYDTTINNNVIEECHRLFRILSPQSVRITDNVIEGLDGYVGYFGGGRGLTVEKNYFEACDRKNFEGYFIYRNLISGKDDYSSFALRDNVFIGTTEQTAETYYVFRGEVLPYNMPVENNTSDMNLYYFSNNESVMSNSDFLKSVYSENSTAKYAYNKCKNINFKSTYGSVNLLSSLTTPLDLNQFNIIRDWTSEADVFDNGSGAITVVARKDGIKNVGLSVKQTIKLQKDKPYVLGVRIIARKGNQGNIIFRLYDDKGITVYEQRFKPQNYENNRMNFFSLDPFTIEKFGVYSVALTLEHDTTVGQSNESGISNDSGFSLENLVLQTGMVAQI